MKLSWILLLFAAVIVTCCGTIDQRDVAIISATSISYCDEEPYYLYDSLSIPQFFDALYNNHRVALQHIDSSLFASWYAENKLLPGDSVEEILLGKIQLLHRLFTAQYATNGSRGEIINIPYFWHWVKPNPRHEITDIVTGKKLVDLKPPKGYGKYATYADMDRTPDLFLIDLFSNQPKYYTEECDTFATFGWCSEREMSFVAITSLMGFESKVIVSGNHSWSELLLPMKNQNGQYELCVFQVDNTFDVVAMKIISEDESIRWRADMGKAGSPKWYNDQAHSMTNLNRISEYVVPPASMEKMESALVKWIRKKM